MAARITRSKKKIATAGIPYRVPAEDDLPERLDGVLTVIHLVFTAGYASAGERLVRDDLVDRALDLARVLAVLMPDEPEALGLLALLELTDARRAGARRRRGAGSCVLEDQDRARWDARPIARGEALLARGVRASSCAATPAPGRFLLQAAIAGAHDEAPSWAATDWAGHRACSTTGCARVWPSPVVDVNRAVAVAFARGPRTGSPCWTRSPVSAEPARLALPARGPRRPAAPPRAPRGGGRGLHRGAGARVRRRRARVPAPPPRRGRRYGVTAGPTGRADGPRCDGAARDARGQVSTARERCCAARDGAVDHGGKVADGRAAPSRRTARALHRERAVEPHPARSVLAVPGTGPDRVPGRVALVVLAREHQADEDARVVGVAADDQQRSVLADAVVLLEGDPRPRRPRRVGVAVAARGVLRAHGAPEVPGPAPLEAARLTRGA